jgi:hypothetical protein
MSVDMEKAWEELLESRNNEVPKRYGWNIRRVFEAGFSAGSKSVRPRLYTAHDEVRSSGWFGGRP